MISGMMRNRMAYVDIMTELFWYLYKPSQSITYRTKSRETYQLSIGFSPLCVSVSDT